MINNNLFNSVHVWNSIGALELKNNVNRKLNPDTAIHSLRKVYSYEKFQS